MVISIKQLSKVFTLNDLRIASPLFRSIGYFSFELGIQNYFYFSKDA